MSDIARILGISRPAVHKMLDALIDEKRVRIKEEGRTFLIEEGSLPETLRERMKNAQEEAAEKAKNISIKNGRDINFEKDLWAAADKLRGNIDAAEYKHVVLGLIFLKYVSDAFYQRRRWLEEQTADAKNKEYFLPNQEDRSAIIDSKDEYKSKGIYFIPEKARWEFLRGKAMHPDIGKSIDEAMEAIENENAKQLKGVLPKIFARTPLESQVLGELVNIFSKIQFDHDFDKEKDTLGRVYEYFLGQFASAEGKRGGEFFTPRPIVKLLVEIMEPYENVRVFDPACGSGGMFVQSAKFLEEHDKDKSRISFFGQESNPTTLKLCKMNLAIRGINGQIELGNTYYQDKYPDLRADFVIANPPFNADWDPSRLADNDPRILFGTPPGSNANFMWIQHFIHHLSPNGVAGFVMANGALAVSGREGEIRRKIIEADLVDVIVACPPKLFYNVALPVSLWFLSKNKASGRFRSREREILFIDAREVFEPISRKQVIFTDDQIQKIASTVRSWREEKGAKKYEDVVGFCKAVKLDEVAKNGFVLTPGRYVGVAEEEDDGVPFKQKMLSLSHELFISFKRGQELEKEIESNLNQLRDE